MAMDLICRKDLLPGACKKNTDFLCSTNQLIQVNEMNFIVLINKFLHQ